jgi:hypothetical protein
MDFSRSRGRRSSRRGRAGLLLEEGGQHERHGRAHRR